jgi:3-hydroxyisobutyrate dehydrogenase-like beta-hydroxyacid dehydrogenase
MVGGDVAALDRCRPILHAFAGNIVHLGDVGAGQIAKVLNNLVFTALLGVALDSFALARHVGVDRQAMAEVLEHGSGGSRAATILAMSGFDPSALAGAAVLLRKDVGIALGLADDAGGLPTRVLGDAATRTVDTLKALR